MDSFGVDIKKPFETMPLEPDENGYLEYCVCQYAVFGSCQEDFTHQIGDVTFGCSDCHPNTKIDEEHFVLDLYPIHLPFEETKVTDDETPEMQSCNGDSSGEAASSGRYEYGAPQGV